MPINTNKTERNKVSMVWYPQEILNDKEKKERFTSSLLSNKVVADRLYDILFDMIERLGEGDSIDYNVASWSHRQAHLNGVKEAYMRLFDLIEPLTTKKD